MKMKPIALAPILALVAAPLVAQPAPSPHSGGGGGKFFDATDTNKDGALTKEEWAAAGRNPDGFAMMDLNKDGKVTREEGREAMQRVMQARKMQSGQ